MTVSNSGGTSTASFAGSENQRISLNFSSVTITASKISILKPNGNNLVSPFTVTKSGYFLDVQTLPASGTYKIVVDPKDTYTGKMTLRLYDVPPDPTGAVLVDGSATVTTTTPGQNASLTFAGTAGQRVSVDLTDVTYSSAKLKLYNPDGTLLYPTALTFGAGGGFLEPKTALPATGVYTLSVDPKLLAVGSATLHLYSVPDDVLDTVQTNGTLKTVTTTKPGQNAYLTFDGTANQRVSFLFSNSGFDYVKVSVLNPDGSQLTTPAAVGPSEYFISPKKLLSNGTYKVFVDPQGADVGSLDAQAYTVVDQTGAITLGVPLTASTSTPGQNALFTFAGTKNWRVSLDLTNVSYSSVKVSILRFDGSALMAAKTVTPAGAYVDPITLPATETYTVKIDPQFQAIGSLDVGLYLVPADVSGTLTSGVTTHVAIGTPGQNAVYTYAGTSGQRLAFNLTNVTLGGGPCCGAKLTVTKPDGSTLFPTTSFGTDGKFIQPSLTSPMTLPTTGTYKVKIDPQLSSTGELDLTLYVVPADASATSGALTAPGVNVSVTTTAPAQNAKVLFTGAIGQRFAFKLNSFVAGSCPVKVSILRPDNTTFKSPTCASPSEFEEFFDPTTLVVAGQYKIVVDPQGAAFGTASFTLYAVPADATGSLGAGTPVNLTPGQNASYTFSGTSGTSATITESNGATISLTRVELLAPNGTSLQVVYWDTGGGSFTVNSLPATGTYTVSVDPQGGASGSMTLGHS